MKIVAYSRIPSSTPFVHLGYLAASTTTTKPVQGLLFGGVVILVAGLSVMSGRLFRSMKSAEPTQVPPLRMFKLRRIGLALVLLSGAILWSAFAFGEKDRVFHYPERATYDRLWDFRLSVADRCKPENSSDSKPKLPTQEGQYVLSSALGIPAKYLDRCTDGWDTPLMLQVTRQREQLQYIVVSAGPDRTWGTQDDITDPNQLKEESSI